MHVLGQWLCDREKHLSHFIDLIHSGDPLISYDQSIGSFHAEFEKIYGWFTEGFGTPDLRGAKVLLDELS